MTRLDHNRAIAQLAGKTGAAVSDITNMTVWGNHSPSMFPDLFNAKIGGDNAAEVVNDEAWYAERYIPTVGKRGAAIIEARGASSAASAANAAIDHVHDWVLGTPEGDWVSMAVPSDGAYGVAEGIISSFACTCSGGEYTIVEGLEVNDFAQRADRRDRQRAQGGARGGRGAGPGLTRRRGSWSSRPVRPCSAVNVHSPRRASHALIL